MGYRSRYRPAPDSDEEEIKLVSDNARVRLHELLKFFVPQKYFQKEVFWSIQLKLFQMILSQQLENGFQKYLEMSK